MKIIEWIIRIICTIIVLFIMGVPIVIVSFLLWDHEYLEHWTDMLDKTVKFNNK